MNWDEIGGVWFTESGWPQLTIEEGKLVMRAEENGLRYTASA